MKRDDLFDDKQAQLSSSHSENEEQPQSKNKAQKTFMPQEYHKAKRNVNKLILQYFTNLKNEIGKGATLFLNRSKLQGIMTAITYYVGIRYNQRKQFMELKLRGEDLKKKQNKNGLFTFLSQSDKIINYNLDGKVNIISLQKGAFKLPDLATPLPYQSQIFLLDPCSYDAKRKVFVPCPPALMVQPDGKLKQIASPTLYRSKCALVRDRDCFYLLGGYATQQKIITNRCERYYPSLNKFEEIEPMKHRHNCPSACLVNKRIWVMSSHYIEYYEDQEWSSVEMRWNVKFLPFQYVFPINQAEIIILGGMNHHQKSNQIKIFNTKEGSMINYGQLLPQGVCNERSWGPCVIHGCLAIMSSIQASVYPQVGIKSSMTQIIYVHQNSAYLNNIISA